MPFHLRPARREQPPGVLETHRFPPTVLLKSGAQLGGSCPVISRLGRGAEHEAKRDQASTFLVGAEAGVQSSARDQGEQPSSAGVVEATSDGLRAQAIRLNPGVSS
jgi:hypothetical protein